MKLKVIAIVHMPASVNNTWHEKINIGNGKFTSFNDNKQFWFFSLGSNFMDRYSSKVDFEIWQPDTNISIPIIRKYDNGLIYRLIPGMFIKVNSLFGTKDRLFSSEILNAIENEINNHKKLVLFFKGTNEFILNKIVSRYFKQVPFVGMFSVRITDQLIMDQFFKKPLFEIYHYLFSIVPYKRFLKKVENIVPSTQNDVRSNQFFESLRVFYRDDIASWGIDTDFWSRNVNALEIKEKYGIHKDEKILLISSRVVEEKQLKEMILVLNKFSNENFRLIITGNINSNHYGNEVDGLIKCLLPEKVIKTGYITDEELIEIYSISDLMLSYSISEGGPFSIFQAYLMEVPVIQSSVGIAGEIALQYEISKLVNPFETEELASALRDFFSGSIPKTLDRNIAVNYFSWEKITSYYYDIFKSVVNSTN